MKKWLSLIACTILVVSITGCDGDDGISGVAGVDGEDAGLSVSFKSIATPSTDEEKNALNVSDTVTVNGQNQSISATKLLSTGDNDNGEIYGLSKDMNDAALQMDDGNPYICNGTSNPNGSGSGLDFVSILQKNDKLYMVSQFECQIGSMYINELTQNTNTGELSVKANTLKFISQKSEFGGYVHCAGMKTPWESHLGSEEYEPNARDLNVTSGEIDQYYGFIDKYWGGDLTKANPYYYGWTPEVTIDANGNSVYTKHYSMGRMSHELSYVMPDNKTVYMSDDGDNVGLFMYVADEAMDLSSGTLYAAKWHQKSSLNGGSAYISWIELAHATDAEIRAYLDPDDDVTTNDSLNFTDIFDVEEPNASNECPTVGFLPANTSFGLECLRVKAGMDKAAAYLETRRYAGMMGATTEFRKEEGITFDAANNKLYVGMSQIAKGMEDNKKYGVDNDSYDKGSNNDIKLPFNDCGAVYELEVNNAYQAISMQAVITGTPIDEDANGNKCDLNGISNPDNVTFLPDSNILMIGEDTGNHENNIVWAYDLKKKELQRVIATPLGAETTSPFWYKDINGFGYMMVVTQHPDTTSDDAGQSSASVLGPIKF